MPSKKPNVAPTPPPNNDFRQIEVELSLMNALRREAALRDMNTNYLIRALLDTIVRDNLTMAILDE